MAYNTTLSSLTDKHAPIVTKLSRCQSPSNPWFTPTLCHTENLWKRTTLPLTGPPPSLSITNTTTSSCFAKRLLLQPCIFSLRQPQTSLANSQHTPIPQSSSLLPTTSPGTSLADSFVSSFHRQNIQTPSFSHQQSCYIISAFTLSSRYSP